MRTRSWWRLATRVAVLCCLGGMPPASWGGNRATAGLQAGYAAWKAQAGKASRAKHAEAAVIENGCVRLGCSSTGSWGLWSQQGNPDDPADDDKALTHSPCGDTNGLSVEVDDTLYVLNERWSEAGTEYITTPLALAADGASATIVWTLAGLTLSAHYELVNGDSGRPDTAKVTYTVVSPPAAAAHRIGFKVGLDTEVGTNDGARLTSAAGTVGTETGFGVTGSGGHYAADVPGFWQALEADDLAHPGVVAQGTLAGGGATPPDKLVVGDWQEQVADGSAFDYVPTGLVYGDSAVGLWWFDRPLEAGSSLCFVVLYGLGRVTSSGTDLRLGVSAPEALGVAGGGFDPNPFTVLVQLQNDTGALLADLSVSLGLPAGLSVATGGGTTQFVTSLANGATALVAFALVADPVYGNRTLTYTVAAAIGQPYAVSLEKAIRLPAVAIDCDASPWNFAHAMHCGFSTYRDFPQVVTTVRVDTEAGRRGGLTAAHVGVTEDGVPQTLTAVTCAAAGNSLADIVFVVDDSASMSAGVDTLKELVTPLAARISAAGVDARFGLVTFGDTAEVDLILTRSVTNLQNAVDAVTATGGGDWREAALGAVLLAARAMAWRPEAPHLFVVVTDAPVHTLGDGSGLSDCTMAATIAAVRAVGGTVFAAGPVSGEGTGVDNDGNPAPGTAWGASDDIRTLAVETGGFWQDLAGAGLAAFVGEVADVVTSLYTVSYTTSNTARDGRWREVVVTVSDPWAALPESTAVGLTDCDRALYRAPQGVIECAGGAGDLVHVTGIDYGTAAAFPAVTATVRVDTQAGLSGGLDASHFALAEDGVWQPIIAVTGAVITDPAARDAACLYQVTYLASNRACDGTWREVVVQANDPVAGNDCDRGVYPAPWAPLSCENGQGHDVVSIMAAGCATADVFPQTTVTVRVDTAAGRCGGLGLDDFALSEDGIAQTLTAVTCAASGGSVVDLVVCFDDTGSMGSQAAALKERATGFANDLVAGGVDARFALVSFRDDATVDLDFTADPGAFQGAVNVLSATGGDDLPEASLDAVMLALVGLSWRPGAQRFVVVITDAPSHYRADGSACAAYTMDEVIDAALGCGVSVLALAPVSARSEGVDNCGKRLGGKTGLTRENDIRVLAESTGGFWQEVGAVEVGAFLDEIVAVITSLYTLTYSTSHTACDGTWRQAIVAVRDPGAGTDSDDGWYLAPAYRPALEVAPSVVRTVCRTGTSPAGSFLRVRNAGVGPMPYSLSESVDWLMLPETAGRSSGEWDALGLAFATASLPVGEYVGEILVEGDGESRVVPVHLTVTDLLVARHFADGCHEPGGTLDVTVTFDTGGAVTVDSLALAETWPAGWTFVELISGEPLPQVLLPADPLRTVGFTWDSMPEFPYALTYRVRAPGADAGVALDQQCVSGTTAYRSGELECHVDVTGAQCLELTDCAAPGGTHQADQNGDWTIQLSPELTRLVQFSNRRGYHCQAGTEDGYAPGVGATFCGTHRADQNGDWVVQLSPELTRLIQFYNHGGYHRDESTEDGFAPGPAGRKRTARKGTLSSWRTFGSPLYGLSTPLDVHLTVTHTASTAVSSLAIREVLPPGWSFVRVVSWPPPPIQPAEGTTGTLDFAWIAVPPTWPVEFVYEVSAPAEAFGVQTFAGSASFREDAGETTVMTPDAVIDGPAVTITFEAGANGWLDGPTPQMILQGSAAIPVTAVPGPGYVFDQWSDGSRENPRCLIQVDTDQVLTARFRAAGPAPPSGEFVAVLDADGAVTGGGLWDLTGLYSLSVAGHPLVLHLVHDAKGRLTGHAFCTVGQATPLALQVRGRVTGAAGTVIAAITLKGTSPDRSVAAALGFSLGLSASTRQLRGEGTGTIRSAGATEVVREESLVLPVPGPMDGRWALRVWLSPLGTAVGGTARLTLSNGATHACLLKGRIVGPATVNINVFGAPEEPLARAIRLAVTVGTLEGESATLQAVSGRGYGQALAR